MHETKQTCLCYFGSGFLSAGKPKKSECHLCHSGFEIASAKYRKFFMWCKNLYGIVSGRKSQGILDTLLLEALIIFNIIYFNILFFSYIQ